MPRAWQTLLDRWLQAGVVDAATAERIRAFEAGGERAHKLRWPVVLAWSLGGLLICAGVLLFVAAHWDELSPAARFGLVLGLVALFHLLGAWLSSYSDVLASVLHAMGTVSLGAGIFLAAQIFHLQEHWPSGFLLWAVGAGLGWWLLRDWVQASLVAVLAPVWLSGEWIEATLGLRTNHLNLAEGWALLAATYFTARTPEKQSPLRRALMGMGGLALLPAVGAVVAASRWGGAFSIMRDAPVSEGLLLMGWGLALGLPLALAYLLRGRQAWLNLVAAAWVVVLGTMRRVSGDASLLAYAWGEVGPYVWCGLGSVGLVWWGWAERRPERINLGVAGFALTVLFFYFSTVMDKLGRSASLIGLGLLFLVGGWILERTRRRLIAGLGEAGK